MSAFLLREAAPLSAAEWAKIDDMVVTVVKKNLVGRRLLALVGPLGWGVDQAPRFGFGDDAGAFVATSADYLPLEEQSAEFVLTAKQMAMAAETPFGLDLGAVAIAATKVSRSEDMQILGGMMAAAGARAALGDWGVLGDPFKAIATAQANLLSAGFDGPYALVLGPALYAALASLWSEGRREFEAVEKLVTLGIQQSVIVPDGKALLVSPQAWNVDMVVGQDVVTAYVGNQGMDHRYRVFETVALRVKQAGSICVLG